METITRNDIKVEVKDTLSITFTLGHDVYITKEFTRVLNLPERFLLFHFEEGKMRISTTDKSIGFQTDFKQGMTRVKNARNLAKYMDKEKSIKPGTRITFYDEPVDGYYIEKGRAATKPRGKKPATNNPI